MVLKIRVGAVLQEQFDEAPVPVADLAETQKQWRCSKCILRIDEGPCVEKSLCLCGPLELCSKMKWSESLTVSRVRIRTVPEETPQFCKATL